MTIRCEFGAAKIWNYHFAPGSAEVVSRLPLALMSDISFESLRPTLFRVAWAIFYMATSPESPRYGWTNGQSFTSNSILVINC